jgi:hypothetical protein
LALKLIRSRLHPISVFAKLRRDKRVIRGLTFELLAIKYVAGGGHTGTPVAVLSDGIMKTLYLNLRLLLNGDTVMVVISGALFLASVANATHWAVLQRFQYCGICTLLLSLTFGLLSGMESLKPGRKKRTIVATVLLWAAVLVCLSQGHLVVNQGN